MQRSLSFAILATITNNRRRESSSHKAKKSTEKSSGAASEPSPSSASHSQNFQRTPLPGSPATTTPEASRSFQGLPPRPPLPRSPPPAAARLHREGGGGAGRRGRRRRGEGEARVWGRCRCRAARHPVREEEDAYDAAAQEHRLRPLVSLRSGESSISRPIPHRDWWPGHPHWVFNDAIC